MAADVRKLLTADGIGGWATSPGGDGIYLQVSRVDHLGLEDRGTTARL